MVVSWTMSSVMPDKILCEIPGCRVRSNIAPRRTVSFWDDLIASTKPRNIVFSNNFDLRDRIQTHLKTKEGWDLGWCLDLNVRSPPNGAISLVITNDPGDHLGVPKTCQNR